MGYTKYKNWEEQQLYNANKEASFDIAGKAIWDEKKKKENDAFTAKLFELMYGKKDKDPTDPNSDPISGETTSPYSLFGAFNPPPLPETEKALNTPVTPYSLNKLNTQSFASPWKLSNLDNVQSNTLFKPKNQYPNSPSLAWLK